MKTKDTETARNDLKKDTKRVKDEQEKPETNDLKYSSDLTEHDKDILKQEHVHGDGGDDQQLKDRKKQVDFAGSDLDVPGREKAKKGNGPQGLNDEENKVHSQGSAHNADLERDELP